MYIGLTGPLRAGKGEIAKYLQTRGFSYASLSDTLRELATAQGVELTRDNLSALGNKLREEKGAGALAQLVYEKVKAEQNPEKARKYVIDGIRHPEEVERLSQFNRFYLVSVDAPLTLRFERTKACARENDPGTLEDFIKVDERDSWCAGVQSQSVRTMALADYHLFNNYTKLEPFFKDVNRMLEVLSRLAGRPHWPEFWMRLAWEFSARSSCDRLRAGSIIVKDRRLISEGWNGSPPGQPHCDDVGHEMDNGHCVRTVHAEQNAIINAGHSNVSLHGAEMYSTGTPCYICAKMIVGAGIRKVTYGFEYRIDERAQKLFARTGISFSRIQISQREKF